MCGIAGFMGFDPGRKFMTGLLLEIEPRGPQATGLAWRYPNSSIIRIEKKAMSAYAFQSRSVAFEEAIGGSSPKAILLHTRLPTMGANTDENAHPFRKGKIVGVHNGYISSCYEISRRLNVDFQVDSETVFSLIDKEGVDGLPSLSGSMALAWMDETEPNTLCLYRDTNPTYIGYDEKNFAFCSTPQTLRSRFSNVTATTPYSIYKIRMDANGKIEIDISALKNFELAQKPIAMPNLRLLTTGSTGGNSSVSVRVAKKRSPETKALERASTRIACGQAKLYEFDEKDNLGELRALIPADAAEVIMNLGDMTSPKDVYTYLDNILIKHFHTMDIAEAMAEAIKKMLESMKPILSGKSPSRLTVLEAIDKLRAIEKLLEGTSTETEYEEVKDTV